MKRLLPIVMLLFGAPLFAQPRVLIDNRTDHDVDTGRVRRMAAEALVNATVNEPVIVVHLWPRKALRSMTGGKLDSFFVGPNHAPKSVGGSRSRFGPPPVRVPIGAVMALSTL